MRRAQQLPLTLSIADSVTVQLDRDRAEAYAQAHYDRAEALAEKNAHLEEALKAAEARTKAAEARALDLQRELLFVQTLAKTWEAQAKLWRRTDLPMPRVAPSKDVLTELLVLAHPDKWQGQNAETLAHELSVVINKLREGGQV